MQTISVLSAAGVAQTLDLGSSGAPPSLWPTLGFNDSGWSPCLQLVTSGIPRSDIFGATIAGAVDVCQHQPPGGSLDQWLLRHNFVVPTGSVLTAALQIIADDFVEEIYLNGVAIDVTEHQFHSPGVVRSYSLSPSNVRTGSNVLALHLKNLVGTSSNPTTVLYSLILSIQNAIRLTHASGPNAIRATVPASGTMKLVYHA